jgi:hypothetical protein
MKIDLIDLTMRDLVAGYSDDGEGGVRGYGGKLDIRPPILLLSALIINRVCYNSCGMAIA